MRHRPRTFCLRLALGMAALSLAVLALSGTAIFFGVRRALWQNLDAALLSIARTEVASGIDEANRPVHVHEEKPSPLSLPIGSGYEKLATIVDARGKLLAQTANLTTAPLVLDPGRVRHAAAGEAAFVDLWRGAERYRGIYYPIRDREGNALVAVVAISTRPLQRSLQGAHSPRRARARRRRCRAGGRAAGAPAHRAAGEHRSHRAVGKQHDLEHANSRRFLRCRAARRLGCPQPHARSSRGGM